MPPPLPGIVEASRLLRAAAGALELASAVALGRLTEPLPEKHCLEMDGRVVHAIGELTLAQARGVSVAGALAPPSPPCSCLRERGCGPARAHRRSNARM